MVDSLGNVVHEETHYPYGVKRSSKGDVDADYTYTGKEYDPETGLIYFGGRYYSPEMGRWLTPDPLFLEGNIKKLSENPESSNLYSYVNQNPVNMVDEDGFETVGYMVSFSGGVGGGGRVGYVIVGDDKGNIGFLWHGSGGGYEGAGGATGSLQITNANTIYDLEGKTFSVGGSGGVPVGISGDLLISGDGETKGLEIGGGLMARTPVPLEFHGMYGTNKIQYSINIFDKIKNTLGISKEDNYDLDVKIGSTDIQQFRNNINNFAE